MALVRELGVSVVRYPGGNFVSGYRWEDGVGPKDQRPRRRELAWTSTETNQFGTDEFVDWCRATHVEPMLAVNLGTRGPAEAGDLYEYCNHASGTKLSDWRIANGHQRPHDVELWCLGNEMDGPWQMGAKPAGEYGRAAREAAKLMCLPDANRSRTEIFRPEFIACGSSSRGMATFGQWDETVLEECFEKVDYLSVHSYVSPRGQDVPSFLAFADTTMGMLIDEVTAICDAVAAKRKSRKRIHLSYDEWNVWYFNLENSSDAWSVAPPLLEDQYTLADALCVGAMMNTLLNHCDRVKIACLAQLVNVIGPIMTRTGGPAWRQTIFYPFAQAARFAKGSVLRTVSDGPTYKSQGMDVSTVSTSVVRGDDGGVTVFALNRDLEKATRLNLELRSFAELRMTGWSVLDGDLNAVNSEEEPDRVKPREAAVPATTGRWFSLDLPKGSWNVLRFSPA